MVLASCSFSPVYGPDGQGARWQNTIAVDAPASVLGFVITTRIAGVFGPAPAAQYQLTVTPEATPVPATITVEGDSTRFNLTGKAAWSLTDQSGETVADGLVQAFTSYAATGSTVATQTAQSDAQARLGVALADLIAQQIILSGTAS